METIISKDLENANFLLSALGKFNDNHSIELKTIFREFIENPNFNLRERVINTKTHPDGGYLFLYNDLDINATLSEIFFS